MLSMMSTMSSLAFAKAFISDQAFVIGHFFGISLSFGFSVYVLLHGPCPVYRAR